MVNDLSARRRARIAGSFDELSSEDRDKVLDIFMKNLRNLIRRQGILSTTLIIFALYQKEVLIRQITFRYY